MEPERIAADLAELPGRPDGWEGLRWLQLTPGCYDLLRTANRLRRRRRLLVIDGLMVVKAAALAGTNDLARVVAIHTELTAEEVAGLPKSLRSGLARALRQTRCGLGSAEGCSRRGHPHPASGEWDDRSGPIHRFYGGVLSDTLGCLVPHRDQLLVLLLPRAGQRWFGAWLSRRFVAGRSRQLARVSGARAVDAAVALRSRPRRLIEVAGSLNRAFFEDRRPAGRMRPMEAADAPYCQELYALLERRRQVPMGFTKSFEDWLTRPTDERLIAESDGRRAGCGGWNHWPQPETESDRVSTVRGATLSYGLVHPEFQRRGIGSTLLAARLLAAWHGRRQPPAGGGHHAFRGLP